MVTSRSSSALNRWTAGARVFAGRPDPEWDVPSEVAERLVALWDQLPPTGRPSRGPPPLGYRGCYLRRNDRAEWRAWGGNVVGGPGLAEEVRLDPGRRFELMVLETAPPGRLPPGVPDWRDDADTEGGHDGW
jgi:hypothetical protein